jgi:cell division protein FtsA
MEKTNGILSLDLGANSIHGVIAKINEEKKIEILSANTYSSAGVKNGVISDIGAAKFTVDKFLGNLEEFNIDTVDIISAVRGSLIDVVSAKTRIKINDDEENGTVTGTVTEKTMIEIERRLAEANKIDDTKEIIAIIPQQYKIDEQAVQNPEQMIGKFLELKALMICGTKSNISNIMQTTRGNILKYGYSSIAEELISNDDKDLGCILVDIGGMTTGIVVYVEGKIKDSFELPFGSDYISRDIAAKLKITKKEATSIKEKHGVILEELIDNPAEEIEYTLNGNRTQKVSVKELIEVINAQVALQLREMSKAFTKRGIIPTEFIGGFILTGGGSLLKGMPEAFSKVFNGALAKIANFTENDFICKENNIDIINSQLYTTALAILKSNYKSHLNSNIQSYQNYSMWEKIKNFFKNFK